MRDLKNYITKELKYNNNDFYGIDLIAELIKYSKKEVNIQPFNLRDAIIEDYIDFTIIPMAHLEDRYLSDILLLDLIMALVVDDFETFTYGMYLEDLSEEEIEEIVEMMEESVALKTDIDDFRNGGYDQSQFVYIKVTSADFKKLTTKEKELLTKAIDATFYDESTLTFIDFYYSENPGINDSHLYDLIDLRKEKNDVILGNLEIATLVSNIEEESPIIQKCKSHFSTEMEVMF